MYKQDLTLGKPLINAAGTLGFAPDYRRLDWLEELGAFVTNPVSYSARSPAHGERFVEYPGGMLIHTGYPNRGIHRVLKKNRDLWSRSPLPIIVHLLAEVPETLEKMVMIMEGVEGVLGLELGIPPEANQALVMEFVDSAVGELPLIVRLPFETCLSIPISDDGDRLSSTLQELDARGVSAISMTPPRGELSNDQGDFTSGRLYGPSIFPLALRAVQRLVGSSIPVIGSGGLYNQDNIDLMLNAGAMAVQLDTILWNWGVTGKLNTTA